MGVINPANTLDFTSTDNLFARVRKRLSSYDASGLIDEGDFYYFIKDVLERLGVSVYEEQDALLKFKDFKAPLPENFSYLYAAYKCSPTTNNGSHTLRHSQGGFVIYNEERRQSYKKCTGCWAAKINFVEGEKITVETFVEGVTNTSTYNAPTLLKLVGHTQHANNNDCKNINVKSPYGISINNGFVYSNFDGDVYMKYYGLPMDIDSGLPLIPHNTFIEKAIEDYIIYRVMEDIWFNGTAPDMQTKYQVAKLNSDESMKSALYYVKLPSFQSAINYIRFNRGNLSVYQQTTS